MSEKKVMDPKSEGEVRDLPSRDDPKGGRLSYSKEPPLSIPPPGFITSSENGKSRSRKPAPGTIPVPG